MAKHQASQTTIVAPKPAAPKQESCGEKGCGRGGRKEAKKDKVKEKARKSIGSKLQLLSLKTCPAFCQNFVCRHDQGKCSKAERQSPPHNN